MQIEEIEPTGDNPLFYRKCGDGNAVVFIHSYLLDSRLFLDQLTGLSGIYTCYAPDLRGHGRSSAEIRRDISEEEDADDIIAFIKSVCKDQKVHLIGFSAGGIISALVQQKVPELIDSLTLLSTNFIVNLDESYKRYQAELARLVVIEGKDALFRRFNEYILAANASLISRARYKTMLCDQSFELIVSFLTGTAIQARPEIPNKINGPVFLPYGDEDVVMTNGRAEKVMALYKNASAEVIPAAGRLLPLENPEALNEALVKFLGNL